MAGIFASHRARRRVLVLGLVLGLAGGIAAAAALVGNTGHTTATPIDSTEPAWTYKAPSHHRLTKQDTSALIALSAKFVQTAVQRKQLDSAWEMIGPELRAGQTRHSWDTGNNNVVPFKSTGIARWDVLYSYPGDVAFDVVLLGAKSQSYLSKTFLIELKRHSPHGRWLVASWQPRGVSSLDAIRPSERPTTVAPVHAPLSKWFLFVPGAIFGGMIALLAAWGSVALLRSRRSARRYAQALGHSSSSSPS